MNGGLFLGQLANHDDQHDHHRYADHRPNPHPPAKPSSHPSVCMIHHKVLLVVLRPTPLGGLGVSGGSVSIGMLLGRQFIHPIALAIVMSIKVGLIFAGEERLVGEFRRALDGITG